MKSGQGLALGKVGTLTKFLLAKEYMSMEKKKENGHGLKKEKTRAGKKTMLAEY